MTRKKEGRNPSTFGKALVNQHRRGRKKVGTSDLHVADIVSDDPKNALGSIVDRNELDEFLAEAMMKEQEFEVEKKRNMILIDDRGKKIHLSSAAQTESAEAAAHPSRESFDSAASSSSPSSPALSSAIAPESSSSSSSSSSSLSGPALSSLSSDVLLEYEVLRIPRRPKWTKSTTAEELDRAEKDSFLEWRRNIAKIEEDRQKLGGAPTDGGRVIGSEITPFERNLQIWRQLWRVLERCDILVQIVDARNPLLFRCPDLDKYISELSPHKICILVLNKADYLTPTARQYWTQYLKQQGIRAVWFSAYEEQKRIEQEDRKQRWIQEEQMEKLKETLIKPMKRGEKITHVGPAAENASKSRTSSQKDEVKQGASINASASTHTGKEESQENDAGKDSQLTAQAKVEKVSTEGDDDKSSKITKHYPDDSEIYSREQLLDYIRHVYHEKFPNGKPVELASVDNTSHIHDRIQVGMVGYPNVGKSSTINVLLREKRVSVAPTPGKTKHFQTLNIGDDLVVCDAPGLVFPTFLSSRAELLINGVMPIDQMKTYDNYTKPVQLVCNLIPKFQYLDNYSLRFPDDGKTLSAVQLLRAHARLRGFVKDLGSPDESRSARIILKDFVSGKLRFCQPPPNLNPKQQKQFFDSFQFGDEAQAIRTRHNQRDDDQQEQDEEEQNEDEDEDEEKKVGKLASKKTKQPIKRTLDSSAAKEEKDVEAEDVENDSEEVHEEASAASSAPLKINKRAMEATMNDGIHPLDLGQLTLADDGSSASNGKVTKRAARMQAKSLLRRKKGGKKEKLRAQFADTPMEQVGIRVAVRSADLAYRAGSSHIHSIQYNQISEKLPAGKYGSIAPESPTSETTSAEATK